MRLVTHVEIDDAQKELQRRYGDAPEIDLDDLDESDEIHYLPLGTPSIAPTPGIAPAPSTDPTGDHEQSGPRVSLNVQAWHGLELDDDRRLTLLDDRGWSETGWDENGPAALVVTLDEVESTARTVVGPDEPYDDHTAEEMARDHWESLARTAAAQGVEITADRLRELPHAVVLGPRLQALVDG